MSYVILIYALIAFLHFAALAEAGYTDDDLGFLAILIASFLWILFMPVVLVIHFGGKIFRRKK